MKTKAIVLFTSAVLFIGISQGFDISAYNMQMSDQAMAQAMNADHACAEALGTYSAIKCALYNRNVQQ